MIGKNIEEIIETYNSRIHNVVKKFMGSNNQNIDDIKQEVYIKTWKNVSKHRGQSDLWHWINKITVNTCKDHLKSHKKMSLVDPDSDETLHNIADKAITPDKKVVFTERHKQILDAVNKLNPKLKEVIVLYDIHELSYEEISKQVKCPIGTVKSRLFNARKTLKQELTSLLNS